MGNSSTKPPPVVLVPPLFDYPPLAFRTRLLESSYDLLFGKLALRCLFEDYFDQAEHFSTRIMLKPVDDPHVDLNASVSGPLDHQPNESVTGNAEFRWKNDAHDPQTFVDVFVSNTDPILRMRSCAYYPSKGISAFGIFPLLTRRRLSSEEHGVMGLRYGTEGLSLGLSVAPLCRPHEFLRSAWIVSRVGRLTAGVQYQPHHGRQDELRINDLKNWSYSIGYGLGSSSPLSPSFNVGLELARGSQFIASFYQHFVVQRRVKNIFEENQVVGITNYIDLGFELETRVDNRAASDSVSDSTFQVAASWQANKNLLLKGKLGPAGSTLCLAFKSWWNPSFTCSVSATHDPRKSDVFFGFGIRVENVQEASYQRADPNFVMLTPSMEHVAEGAHWKGGFRTLRQTDVKSGNFGDIPKELRPFGKTL